MHSLKRWQASITDAACHESWRHYSLPHWVSIEKVLSSGCKAILSSKEKPMPQFRQS